MPITESVTDISAEELGFFDQNRAALPLYETLRRELLALGENVTIQVKKTQISFKNRYLFAAVSFAPVRRAKDRPKHFLTVTFGLPFRVDAPRIDAAVEPYPSRWTHHVTVCCPEEVDTELLNWLSAAAAFARQK